MDERYPSFVRRCLTLEEAQEQDASFKTESRVLELRPKLHKMRVAHCSSVYRVGYRVLSKLAFDEITGEPIGPHCDK